MLLICVVLYLSNNVATELWSELTMIPQNHKVTQHMWDNLLTLINLLQVETNPNLTRSVAWSDFSLFLSENKNLLCDTCKYSITSHFTLRRK